MSTPDKNRADYDALNDLLVNCPEFEQLEAKLGGFNIFQVFKFETGEIRHSNVLAWICNPDESHGLDDLFLKKWLMRVLHEADLPADVTLSAVDIDTWQLLSVEVRREWRNIDLLLILQFASGESWVVMIENKINSRQHSSQLHRYREIVETEFPGARHRLYIFLTKSAELPEDVSYICASHSQIHQALRESIDSRAHAIGIEPKVLSENYLRVLEEIFMEDSEIARLAHKIYQRHRRALEVLFEHRPDNIRMLSDRVVKLIRDNADKLGIEMEPCTQNYVRFIPRAWNHPGNTHGDAWAGSRRTVMFELNFTGKRPYLYIISGNAPTAWIEPMWERAAATPFSKPKRETRPQKWVTLHLTTRKPVELGEDQNFDPDEMSQRIYTWFEQSYLDSRTQEVIQIITNTLSLLEKTCSEQAF